MMKKIFSLMFFALICTFSFAKYDKTKVNKKAHQAFAEANVAMQMGDAESAKKMLNKAIDADPKFCDALILLGDIFHHDAKNDEAISLYNKALQMDSNYCFKKYKTLGEIYFDKKDYDLANHYFQKYLSFGKLPPPERADAANTLANINFIKNAVAHPVPYDPKPLPKTINSSAAEYYPALSTDGNTLIFTRMEGKPPAADEDFFISKKINGAWQIAKSLGAPVNSHYHEGAITITPDNNFIFFARCDDKQNGMGGCDIYISKKNGDKYLSPNNLGSPINTADWESQPSFSSDGKTLYFAAHRKADMSGIDIYSSSADENGVWSTPKNLGNHINTSANEGFPFIHPDNQTLYFVSNGKTGMGKGDIFFSRKQSDGSWGEAVNMGYPINTEGDERGIFITTDGKKALISRDVDGNSNYDLFEFDLYEGAQPIPVMYLKGIITDARNKKPVEADFQLIDLSSGKVITESTSDGSDGSYIVCIPTGRDYALNVSNPNYLFYSDNFSLKEKKDATPYLKDVSLYPIEIGKSVILKNIFFETNKFDVEKESKIELEKLVFFLNQNKTVQILIGGHTDNSGSTKHNLELSENRAKAVYDYLVQKGIATNRLSYKGFGESKPIADNATEEGKQQNRRTEFTITAK